VFDITNRSGLVMRLDGERFFDRGGHGDQGASDAGNAGAEKIASVVRGHGGDYRPRR